MSYTFGKPQPEAPYTGAGEIPQAEVVVPLLTRVKVVARVPGALAKPGADLPPGFEPHLRKAVADALVGVAAEGFTVVYAAVEQFEGAGG